MMVRFALLLVALCVAFVGRRVEAAEPVNVVVIYADDLGYGDLACYGHPKFKTPNLDRMAAEGARLTQFYSSCGYCAPSRASLMTGRYPHRNNLMLSNPLPKEDFAVPPERAIVLDRLGLPPAELTLGELFQQAGYRTACIGKWHLGHRKQFLPTRAGFDSYYGIPYSNDMHPVSLWQDEQVVEYPVVQATLMQRYTERAVEFIDDNKDRPFFLYFPQVMPHKPLAPSEKFYKKTGTGLYGDVIAEVDWSVGQVLAKLKELGIDRRTIVFFSSDNGPWYGGSTGGLRGMKATWWEGGLRVPLIAWWPGRIPAGQVSDEPAIILDVFATSLAAAGLDVPQDRAIDGKNILPVLTSGAKSPHRALFSYQNRIRTVRVGDWKLHATVSPPDGRAAKGVWVDPRAPNGVTILAPTEQPNVDEPPGVTTGDRPQGAALFNVKEDPSEQRDVAAEHPERVAEMLKLIEQMQGEAGKVIGAGRIVD